MCPVLDVETGVLTGHIGRFHNLQMSDINATPFNCGTELLICQSNSSLGRYLTETFCLDTLGLEVKYSFV